MIITLMKVPTDKVWYEYPGLKLISLCYCESYSVWIKNRYMCVIGQVIFKILRLQIGTCGKFVIMNPVCVWRIVCVKLYVLALVSVTFSPLKDPDIITGLPACLVCVWVSGNGCLLSVFIQPDVWSQCSHSVQTLKGLPHGVYLLFFNSWQISF